MPCAPGCDAERGAQLDRRRHAAGVELVEGREVGGRQAAFAQPGGRERCFQLRADIAAAIMLQDLGGVAHAGTFGANVAGRRVDS